MSTKLDNETSQIGDKHILKEENTTVRENHFFNFGKWRALLFAYLIAFLIVVPIFLRNADLEDPEWDKTHVTATSFLELERIFGNYLLLDKLLSAVPEDPYIFDATLYLYEGGSLEDKGSWESLETRLEYNIDHPILDYISLVIYFNNDSDLNNSDLVFDKPTKTTIINGVEVTYTEFNYEDKYNWYVLETVFTQGDYTYNYSFTSKQNSDLAWKILEEVLSD